MDAGVIVVIVVAALVLLAVLVLVARRGRERRHATRRVEAGQIRREAEVHDARAEGPPADRAGRGARPGGRGAPSARRRGGPGRRPRAARVDPPRRLNSAGRRGSGTSAGFSRPVQQAQPVPAHEQQLQAVVSGL
jgi:HAMP domain-containing protein